MARAPPLRDAQVADAVGEIVNMLAGSMKRKLSGFGADLTLGLPIFIHGFLQPSARVSAPVRRDRYDRADRGSPRLSGALRGGREIEQLRQRVRVELGEVVLV